MTNNTLTNYLIYFLALMLPIFISIFLLNLVASVDGVKGTNARCTYSFNCKQPTVTDPNLKVEMIYQGEFKFEPNNISPVSSMVFLGNDILLLNKNNGSVYKLVNGSTLDRAILDVNVANKRERGLLGVAVSKNYYAGKYIFLYYSESQNTDGSDVCPEEYYCKPGTEPIGNRLYRYELHDNKLINPKLLLDLPATPGPAHNGGALRIGQDNNVYVTTGDLLGDYNKSSSTKAQNIRNGTNPDGRAGILRVTQDGGTVGHGILGTIDPLNKYYAYGIRNSFGIDFDPVTGNLWDTENGPLYGDEINLVKPGFNSGWMVVQGFWRPVNSEIDDFTKGDELNPTNQLVHFEGKGHYGTPQLVWNTTVGPTAIKFLNSDRLGKAYQNDLFVGCVKLGVIFHFDLNKDRTKLKLSGALQDSVADNNEELQDLIFASGLGMITDIEVGPDGYMYVLSAYKDMATIFRIAPVEAQRE